MAEPKKKSVPAVRFKGFEGDWESKRLGDIYTERNERGHDSLLILSVSIHSGISSGELDDEALGKQVRRSKDKSLYKRVYAGDLVLNMMRAWQGAIGVTTTDGMVSPAYITATPDDTVYPQFMDCGLRRPQIVAQMNNLSYGVTDFRKRLYWDSFVRVEFAQPSVPEQERIASHFSHLDSLISRQQRKHDKLVTLKKAMLQKMFPQPGTTTPKIRFNGFAAPWEIDDFGNRVTFFSGLTYSPVSVVSYGGTLVLRSSNVKNGEVVDADNVYVNSAAVDCDNVKEGDLIVVVRNGSRSLIGKHAQVKKAMRNTVIGAFMTGIRGENSSFLNALLDSQQFSEEIEKNMGATINQITVGSFKVMRFAFPCREEQQKIGQYFRTLDTLISKSAVQLDKLKQIKAACLDRMFV